MTLFSNDVKLQANKEAILPSEISVSLWLAKAYGMQWNVRKCIVTKKDYESM